MTYQTKPQRPHGITVIAIWFVLEGMYYFYTNSIGIFGGQNISEIFVDSPLENSLISYGLGLTIFNFIAAYAFWEGKRWIRIPTIIILSISVIVTWILFSFRLASPFEGILSTILIGIVVIYMMKSNVKKYFEKTSLRRSPIK